MHIAAPISVCPLPIIILIYHTAPPGNGNKQKSVRRRGVKKNSHKTPTSAGGGIAPTQQQQQSKGGTKVVQYQRTTKIDGPDSITFHAITAMQSYEQKSFEELRLEDYTVEHRCPNGQANLASLPQHAGRGASGISKATQGTYFLCTRLYYSSYHFSCSNMCVHTSSILQHLI